MLKSIAFLVILTSLNISTKAQKGSLEASLGFLDEPPRWTFASSIFWFLEKSTEKNDEWIFAKDGEIVLTLKEIWFGDGEAVLQDARGDFYLIEDGALWTGEAVTDISKFLAEGSFDSKLVWGIFQIISDFTYFVSKIKDINDNLGNNQGGIFINFNPFDDEDEYDDDDDDRRRGRGRGRRRGRGRGRGRRRDRVPDFPSGFPGNTDITITPVNQSPGGAIDGTTQVIIGK